MLNIHFATPSMFLLLLLLPLFILLKRRRHKPASLFYPTLPWLRPFKPSKKLVVARLLDGLRIVAFVLAIIALARPQLGSTEVERLTEGVDIILTIDTSDSMRAMDFVAGNERVDRLTIVKQVALEFAENRPDDRVGLVVFGEQAFTQCPPTLDHQVLRQFMNWIDIGMVGKGTAIGSAIAVALKRLASLPSKSKVMILLTDGKSTVDGEDPLKAAHMAKALGVKVYTIGVGSKDPVPFPVQGIFGNRVVMRRLELDEELLKEIAFISGGLYFNARDTESLRQIYAKIDTMEKTEIKTKEYHNYHDIFAGFLWPSFIILIALVITESLWIRRLP